MNVLEIIEQTNMPLESYKTLEHKFKRLSHLDHLAAITGWDEQTKMPKGGGKVRSEAMATLMEMRHDLLISDEMGSLIKQAKNESLTSDWEISNFKLIKKQYLKNKSIPSDLVSRQTLASMASQQAWRTCRADNNWKDFAPLLEKTLRLTKECAEIQSDIFNKSPYDILLDEYSPGIDQAIIDPIFNDLEEFLPSFIQKVCVKQQDQPLIEITGEFPPAKQKELGLALMKVLGFDFNHGRLDESHHPFCGGVPEDVRITTRYDRNELISSAMAICHETGHALYEMGLPKEWLSQPVGAALGMSMHESQSLLMEMQACRSPEFMNVISLQARLIFGDTEMLSAENLYRQYTRAKPGFIRVHADEVTYPLHVIMRYKIEKQLIDGDLSVKDLPEVWNMYMQKYFGLSTLGNDMDGVMQDVHWPSGCFGYFPAYTFGALIAAQVYQSALTATPEIPKQIARGDFSPLLGWLRRNVHQYGSKYNFTDLMVKATGQPLNAHFYIDHIQKRYG